MVSVETKNYVQSICNWKIFRALQFLKPFQVVVFFCQCFPLSRSDIICRIFLIFPVLDGENTIPYIIKIIFGEALLMCTHNIC